MRSALFSLAKNIGLMKLWRMHQRNKIVILCLHGVMDEAISTTWVPLRAQYPRQLLDETLTELKRYYTFVSLSDAFDMLRGAKPFVPNSIVLTFDDGYVNNLRHALPILRKHDVPATMYIAVSHVADRKPFWFDRLDYVLQKAKIDGRVIKINGENIKMDASSRSALRESFARLRLVAKKGGRNDTEMLAEIDELCTELEKECGMALSNVFEQDDWSSVVTWDQIQELVNEPLVELGSHTIDHIRLSEVDEARARYELTESKRILEERTNVPCRHFCYPNGNYNKQTAEFAREAGYATAVTTAPGTNDRHDDLMTLKRIHLPETKCSERMLYVASGLAYFNPLKKQAGNIAGAD